MTLFLASQTEQILFVPISIQGADEGVAAELCCMAQLVHISLVVQLISYSSGKIWCAPVWAVICVTFLCVSPSNIRA
jgi:hypothetical protein